MFAQQCLQHKLSSRRYANVSYAMQNNTVTNTIWTKKWNYDYARQKMQVIYRWAAFSFAPALCPSVLPTLEKWRGTSWIYGSGASALLFVAFNTVNHSILCQPLELSWTSFFPVISPRSFTVRPSWHARVSSSAGYCNVQSSAQSCSSCILLPHNVN